MKWIIGLVCMLCGLGLQAQDIKSLYIALPDSLSPLLTKVNRADFCDFLASNMKAEVKNRFGNVSVKVVCVVRTYLGPVADSKVSFYDTGWNELPADRFVVLPQEDRFYKQPLAETAADSLHNLRLYADMYLKEVRLSDKDRSLTVTYTTPDYVDKETAEKLKPYLFEKPLVYEWSNGKFQPIDNKE